LTGANQKDKPSSNVTNGRDFEVDLYI
jgi:hypothetical protein